MFYLNREPFFSAVSIQCLETVYDINKNDPAQVEMLKCDKPLKEIFETATQVCGSLTNIRYFKLWSSLNLNFICEIKL